MRRDHDTMEMSELIELAKKRGLIDSAEPERSKYRVRIGLADFLLARDGTREFITRLLRSYRGY